MKAFTLFFGEQHHNEQHFLHFWEIGCVAYDLPKHFRHLALFTQNLAVLRNLRLCFGILTHFQLATLNTTSANIDR